MHTYKGLNMNKYLLASVAFTLLMSSLEAKCDNNARKLLTAYPNHLVACDQNRIIWKDGQKMIYDDQKKKNFKQRLEQADIEDMFADSYTRAKQGKPAHNYDPGRYRNDKFFRKMYGNSSNEVKANLTSIKWFGKSVKVTTVNNVDKQLLAVENELKMYPRLAKYLHPIGGTFKWRKIAGTDRLSVHSYGAAIDINVKYSAYWRWSKGGYKYQNKIPFQIVKIFEKHGFIWGGKWYHYDTMHFEYRPELLE